MRTSFPPPLPKVNHRYKTRRWSPEQVQAQLVAFAETFSLLASQVPVVWAQVGDDRRGVRGAAYDGSRGRSYADDGSVPGPTPVGYLDREESLVALARAIAAVEVVHDRAGRISGAFAQIMGLDQEKARETLRAETGGADCTECKRFVARTVVDPLRNGLCNACRMRRDRARAGTN